MIVLWMHPPVAIIHSNIWFAVTLTLTTWSWKPTKLPQLHYQPKFGEIPTTGFQDIVLTGRKPGRTHARTQANTYGRKTRKHNASDTPIGGGGIRSRKVKIFHTACNNSKAICQSKAQRSSSLSTIYGERHQPGLFCLFSWQQEVPCSIEQIICS